MSTPITSTIPPTEYSRIVQIKSSPETIAALLNEAENTYSSAPLHWNAKRRYPFWKACQECGRPFACSNHAQARRNVTCSQECVNAGLSRTRTGTPLGKRGAWVKKTCPVCGKQIEILASRAERNAQTFCSKSCRAKAHASHLLAYSDNGRGKKRPGQGLAGSANPAWKGGVTYFRKHGNYAPIKYVRCPAEYLAMARRDGYVMEHRLIVARLLGRCLKRSEVVHHVNHDPTDNRPTNLMLFSSNTAHKRYEGRGEPAPVWQL